MSSGYYESALLRLRRVTAYLNLRYTDVVKEHQLTPVQFEIMMFVGSNGPCSVSDIADFMVVDRSTSSRVLRGIQNKGFLDVILDQGDRRRRKVSLTIAGQTVTDAVSGDWLAVEKDVRAKYDTAIEHLECV